MVWCFIWLNRYMMDSIFKKDTIHSQKLTSKTCVIKMNFHNPLSCPWFWCQVKSSLRTSLLFLQTHQATQFSWLIWRNFTILTRFRKTKVITYWEVSIASLHLTRCINQYHQFWWKNTQTLIFSHSLKVFSWTFQNW